MDKETVIFKWVDHSGLMLVHKDLSPKEILDLYGKKVVKSDNKGEKWKIVSN